MVLSGLSLQRFLPRAVLTLLSVVSLSSLCAQASDVVGTMPEDYLPELKPILQTALQRSPNVIEAQFLIELRDAMKIGADSARLPSVGANINYGSTQLSESGDNTNRSRDNGLFYAFSANQAIFHWGALKNQSAIARINVLMAEKNFAKAYRELGVLLRQQYLQLVVSKARLRQSREALRLMRDSVVVMKERLERGAVSPAEVAGEELRTREMTLEVNRAEADFLTARRSFSRIAGIPEISEDAIPNDIPKPVYSADLTSALSSALLRDGAKSTLEAEIHDLRVHEALLRYRIERVRLLPKFNIGAGYSLENTTTVGTSVGQRAVARQTVSIGANWAIFDGFATRAAKREARAAQRVATARRDAELEAILQEAQALERQLKLDLEQLELSEIRQAMAEQTRDRMAEESRLGNAPAIEVDRAKTGILLAEANNLASRAAFLSRWSGFVSLTGEDPILNNLPVRHAREKE